MSIPISQIQSKIADIEFEKLTFCTLRNILILKKPDIQIRTRELYLSKTLISASIQGTL